VDWTDIEAKLCERAEDVCRHLLPNGHREGGEWVVGSVAGETGHSCKVNLAGKVGVWKDFAGDKGGKTLLSLWMHARNLPKFGYAMKEAKALLGIADDFQKRVQPAVPADPSRQTDDSAWKAVAETWAKCSPLTEGGPVWNYLTQRRRLDPPVLTAWNVREFISHGQWAMVFPYFALPTEETPVLPTAPVPEWLKFELLERPAGKKREWTSKAPEKSLFGVQLAGHPFFKKARHVLICEGEKDALAWATYGCADWGVLPLSVPFGAKWKGQDKHRPSPNREWLDRSWDWLQDFETIFVAMDGDDPGQRAAADIIAEIGPRRCRLVTLPDAKKDANDCLMAGVPREAMQRALDTARDFAPEKIVAAAELEAEFLKWLFDRDADAGVDLPFSFPLRFRKGETTLWLGIEKSGKTTLLNFATVAAMQQGERCLVASFEVPWPDTNDKLCRQAWGGLYYDKRLLKKCASDEERDNVRAIARENAIAAHRWLAPALWYYVHVGIGHWRQLGDDIRWARRRLGITWVQIDNFMRLGILKDDYAQQAEAIIFFVSLAMELQIHLHIVLHQNKSEGAKGHDGGKRSASGAHELLANPHNIVEVKRDEKKGIQISELFEQRKIGEVSDAEFAEKKRSLDLKPDGSFTLHGQRNGDVQDGRKYLWFLWESQQYAEVPPGHAESRAIRFVANAATAARQNELPSSEEMGLAKPEDVP